MAGDGGRAPDVSEQAGHEASPTFWPGQHDREETGPVGDGTPHARMQWFWKRMERHEQRIAELTGWSPFSSNYRFEAAIADAFDRLASSAPSAADPASVLAALLAESPEATVAAIEALLTTDECADAARHQGGYLNGARCFWRDVLSAACRSLLSKAPKEDGDPTPAVTPEQVKRANEMGRGGGVMRQRPSPQGESDEGGNQ